MTSRRIPHKRCATCNIKKPFAQFTKDKSKKDGLRTRCKACDRLYAAAQYQANVDQVEIAAITEKYCSACKQTKPVSEFYRRRDRPCGYANKCKTCRNAYHASYIKTPMGRWNQAKADNKYWLKYGKAYAQTPKGRATARRATKKWRESEHGRRKMRDYHLRAKYGISLTEYEILLEIQQGKCAICGSDGNGKKLHLDHCHKTQKVRGFLCNGCNGGIGLFREDITRLQNAIEYLKKHG